MENKINLLLSDAFNELTLLENSNKVMSADVRKSLENFIKSCDYGFKFPKVESLTKAETDSVRTWLIINVKYSQCLRNISNQLKSKSLSKSQALQAKNILAFIKAQNLKLLSEKLSPAYDCLSDNDLKKADKIKAFNANMNKIFNRNKDNSIDWFNCFNGRLFRENSSKLNTSLKTGNAFAVLVLTFLKALQFKIEPTSKLFDYDTKKNVIAWDKVSFLISPCSVNHSKRFESESIYKISKFYYNHDKEIQEKYNDFNTLSTYINNNYYSENKVFMIDDLKVNNVVHISGASKPKTESKEKTPDELEQLSKMAKAVNDGTKKNQAKKEAKTDKKSETDKKSATDKKSKNKGDK